MSVSVTRLGTNNLTYAHNPDRSGYWQQYLNDLSHQNGLDRQRVNGELNYKAGAYRGKEKKGVKVGGSTRTRAGLKVVTHDKLHAANLIEYYRHHGFNPKYLDADQ